MTRRMIADERYGLRPLQNEPVLSGTFDGDVQAVRLENGCVIDARPGTWNYTTPDGRMFAEVLELEDEADGIGGIVLGYVEVKP